jgi:hypothetical protein
MRALGLFFATIAASFSLADARAQPANNLVSPWAITPWAKICMDFGDQFKPFKPHCKIESTAFYNGEFVGDLTVLLVDNKFYIYGQFRSAGVYPKPGARIAVNRNGAIPVTLDCANPADPNLCDTQFVDMGSAAGVLTNLRTTPSFYLQWISASQTPISVGFPSDGFLRAFNGPPISIEIASKLNHEAIEKSSPRGQAEHRARIEQAKAAQELERRRIAQAKPAFRAKVLSDLEAQGWATEAQLATNPFVFKGRIVAIRTRFDKMLAEEEAVFSLNREIVVGGVPATLFRGNEQIILSVKILGNKAVKTGVGEIILPYGEYVSVYFCASPSYDCREFFD